MTLGLGEAEPATSVSGEAEPIPRGRVRRIARPWGWARRTLPLDIGRDGAHPQMSSEAEPTL